MVTNSDFFGGKIVKIMLCKGEESEKKYIDYIENCKYKCFKN